MRWGDYRRSDNVEDRTGNAPEGGGGGLPFGGMRIGGGALIVIVIVGMLFGINPFQMLGMLSGGGDVQSPPSQSAPPGSGPQTRVTPGAPSQPPSSDVHTDFSRAVLGDTEDVWSAIFKQMGSRYVPPKLILYRGRTSSACGAANAAVGPFYCPADRDLYLDTSFFTELRARFGAPGEFAQAYVIAHEVGHHVQNLLGTMDKYQQRLQRGDNATSVRLELQADCYAGVWGFYSQKRGIIQAKDIEDGMRAAAAVGDDQIQKRTQGYVVPESFTHGSAEQRSRWFRTGLQSGDPRDCDTFASR